MFDVGFFEILFIGLIALIVIGPERLPRVARAAGLWVNKARRFVSDVKSDIDRELEVEEMHRQLQQDLDFSDVKNDVTDFNKRLVEEINSSAEQSSQLVKDEAAHIQHVPDDEAQGSEETTSEGTDSQPQQTRSPDESTNGESRQGS